MVDPCCGCPAAWFITSIQKPQERQHPRHERFSRGFYAFVPGSSVANGKETKLRNQAHHMRGVALARRMMPPARSEQVRGAKSWRRQGKHSPQMLRPRRPHALRLVSHRSVTDPRGHETRLALRRPPAHNMLWNENEFHLRYRTAARYCSRTCRGWPPLCRPSSRTELASGVTSAGYRRWRPPWSWPFAPPKSTVGRLR